MSVCLGVSKNPESKELKGPDPALNLAPIFHFRSKVKNKLEIIPPKRNKTRNKNEKMQKKEKIEKLPKIYKFFSVTQDLRGNKTNQTQLKPSQHPTKAPTSNRTATEDKWGGLSRGLIETSRS